MLVRWQWLGPRNRNKLLLPLFGKPWRSSLVLLQGAVLCDIATYVSICHKANKHSPRVHCRSIAYLCDDEGMNCVLETKIKWWLTDQTRLRPECLKICIRPCSSLLAIRPTLPTNHEVAMCSGEPCNSVSWPSELPNETTLLDIANRLGAASWSPCSDQLQRVGMLSPAGTRHARSCMKETALHQAMSLALWM